jgi:hypothetical protein
MIGRDRMGRFRVHRTMRPVDRPSPAGSRVNLELRLWAALEVLADRLERQA